MEKKNRRNRSMIGSYTKLIVFVIIIALWIYSFSIPAIEIDVPSLSFDWINWWYVLVCAIAIFLLYQLYLYLFTKEDKDAKKHKDHDDHGAHAGGEHHHKPKEGTASKVFGWLLIILPVSLCLIYLIIHSGKYGFMWDGELYTIEQPMEYSVSENMEWKFRCMEGQVKCIFPDGRVAMLYEDESKDKIVSGSSNFSGNSLNQNNQRSTRGSLAGVYTFIPVGKEASIRIKTTYRETRYVKR